MVTDSWYEDTSWQNAGTREFLASVELWCPAKPSSTARNSKVCTLRTARRVQELLLIVTHRSSPSFLAEYRIRGILLAVSL